MIKIIDFIFEDSHNNDSGEEFAILHQNLKIESYKCLVANRIINNFFPWDSDKIRFLDVILTHKLNYFDNLFNLFPEFNDIQFRTLNVISNKYKDVLLILICLLKADVVIYMPALSYETKELYKMRFKLLNISSKKYIVFASVFNADDPNGK